MPRVSFVTFVCRMIRTKRSYWTIPSVKVYFVSYRPSSYAHFRIDQEVVAKLAELDMMVADLERANSRVVTVERRNVR